jgi:hypothetical protein
VACDEAQFSTKVPQHHQAAQAPPSQAAQAPPSRSSPLTATGSGKVTKSGSLQASMQACSACILCSTLQIANKVRVEFMIYESLCSAYGFTLLANRFTSISI